MAIDHGAAAPGTRLRPNNLHRSRLRLLAPAYFAAYVVDPHALDSAVESFIHNLGSGNDPAIPQYHRAREIYRRFSVEQVEVVRAFLRLYIVNEGACARQFAEQAVDLYDAA